MSQELNMQNANETKSNSPVNNGIVDKNKCVDMTFIPKGATNIDDYSAYKIQIFKNVPKKHKIICRNIFTDEIKVKDSGFRFQAPIYKSKLVYVGDTQIDYPVYKFMSLDGVQMLVDYTLNLRITDPERFENENKDCLVALNQLTEDIMRVFVANHKSDNMLGKSFSLRDVDPAGRYVKFAKKYGLLCFDILFKCDVPQSLKDDYEKKKAQERENERALLEAENKKKIAQLEADTLEIKARSEANANAMKISKFIEALTKNGILDDRIAGVLKTKLLSESDAQVIANLGDSDVSRIQSAILSAINQRNNMQNSQQQTSRSQFGSNIQNPQAQPSRTQVGGNSSKVKR